MTTSTSLNTGLPARDISYGVVQQIGRAFAYNTPGIATSANIAIGTLPASSRVTRVVVYIDTAFNAATTNDFVIGTAASANSFATIPDVDLTITGAVEVTDRAAVLTFTSDTTIYLEYDQTGTAASAGAGYVLIEYVVLGS